MNASQENLWPAPFASKSLDATVVVPGSKSLSNRYLILAALGHRPVRLVGLLRSRDTELMMDALDAGADDFDAGEEAAEVTTSPENFTAVCEALEQKGYKFVSADVAQVPSTTTTLTDPDQLVQMGKLLDALDDDDDVQNAWHTLENEEDLDR